MRWGPAWRARAVKCLSQCTRRNTSIHSLLQSLAPSSFLTRLSLLASVDPRWLWTGRSGRCEEITAYHQIFGRRSRHAQRRVCERYCREGFRSTHVPGVCRLHNWHGSPPFFLSFCVYERERKLMMSSHQHTRLNVNAVMSLTDAWYLIQRSWLSEVQHHLWISKLWLTTKLFKLLP